jgi:diacylglycerol kinase (ATP)
MDDMLVLDGGPVDIATLAARFLVNDFLDSEMVVHRRARRVWIDSEPRMVFVTDGDANTIEPATFTVVPGALRVIVGPEYVSHELEQHTAQDAPEATIEARPRLPGAF